jgi:hypothetical protein
VLVSGGGRQNATLMRMLDESLAIPVAPVEAAGLDGDMLEAQAFAHLAVRVLRGMPPRAPAPPALRRRWAAGRSAGHDHSRRKRPMPRCHGGMVTPAMKSAGQNGSESETDFAQWLRRQRVRAGSTSHRSEMSRILGFERRRPIRTNANNRLGGLRPWGRQGRKWLPRIADRQDRCLRDMRTAPVGLRGWLRDPAGRRGGRSPPA